MKRTYEHRSGPRVTVQRWGIVRNYALIVRTEKRRHVERSYNSIGRQPIAIEGDTDSVTACPAQGDVAQLILTAKVVHQLLKLGLQKRHVSRLVVSATSPFDHAT